MSAANYLPPVPNDLLALHGMSFPPQPEGQRGENTATPELKASRRQGTFLQIPFQIGTEPVLIRPKEDRTYFLIQNTGANSLYIGFDTKPSQKNSLNLLAGGFAEPFQVPTNDIWIASTGAGTTGVLIVSIGN